MRDYTQVIVLENRNLYIEKLFLLFMEKDVGKIPKNADTDIVIRVDDFGGRVGVTIREFVSGERYTGFTKAGTRIPAEHFKKFKEAINSIDEKELEDAVKKQAGLNVPQSGEKKSSGRKEESSDIEEQTM